MAVLSLLMPLLRGSASHSQNRMSGARAGSWHFIPETPDTGYCRIYRICRSRRNVVFLLFTGRQSWIERRSDSLRGGNCGSGFSLRRFAGNIDWNQIRTGFFRLPLVIVVLIVAINAMSHWHHPLVFRFGAILNVVGMYFLLPYFLGYAAEQDPSGRDASVTAGAFLLTGAVGPYLGGLYYRKLWRRFDGLDCNRCQPGRMVFIPCSESGTKSRCADSGRSIKYRPGIS